MSGMPLILCVEDDKTFADIVCRSLRREGFEVIHATNGEEGLRKATDETPDAIVLDIGLPKKDGFEVLAALKEDEATKQIPVVMLSRLSSKEDVRQCYDLGCEAYLIKTQHAPEDVADHLKKILKLAGGFTLAEALVVITVILAMLGLLWWQFSYPRPAPVPESGNVILEQGEA